MTVSPLPPPSLGTPPGLSRRGLLKGVAAGAALAGLGTLTGCSTGGGDVAGIQEWDLFQGADGIKMQQMLRDVHRENGAPKVSSTTLAWGAPYYTKLAMASAGGRPPEMAVMHMSRLAGYAPGGLLEPYDLNLLAKVGIHEQDFAPAVWKRAIFDGKLYALPLDTHPFILFYDKTKVDKAGLLGSNGLLAPIDSADAMIDAGHKLASANKGAGFAFGYLLDAAQSWRLFWGLYGQTGGEVSLVPGKKAQLDVPKMTQVIAFLQKLLDGRAASKGLDYNGANAAFTSGRTSGIIAGEWELPNYAGSVKHLDAVPFPTLFGKAANYADSHSFVLPRQADKDEARTEATYRAVAGVLKQSATWAKGGHIPAYQPVLATPAYKELQVQQHYAKAGEIVFLDPPAWFTGAGSDFQNQMCQTLQRALLGGAKPETVATAMVAKINTMLTTPNPA